MQSTARVSNSRNTRTGVSGRRNPTPYWRVPALLAALSRAGWGDLSGPQLHATRAVLGALVDTLDHVTGEGTTTASAIAATAGGYSERWTRVCLRRLELAGIIEWSRGGVKAGATVKSVVRVVKAVLVDLIHAARPMRDAAIVAHRARTQARIARARLDTAFPRPRKPRSVHAELSASPSPYRGGNNPHPEADRLSADPYRGRYAARDGAQASQLTTVGVAMVREALRRRG